jgi:hypothetical protein
MTKEEAAKWAELYKAYADGKKIQYKSGHSEWEDLYGPAFDQRIEQYRVRPEVKKSVGYRVYLWEYPGGVYPYLFHEGTNYETGFEQDCKFKGWIHTEWQYAEFEENT